MLWSKHHGLRKDFFEGKAINWIFQRTIFAGTKVAEVLF